MRLHLTVFLFETRNLWTVSPSVSLQVISPSLLCPEGLNTLPIRQNFLHLFTATCMTSQRKIVHQDIVCV